MTGEGEKYDRGGRERERNMTGEGEKYDRGGRER